MAGQPDVLAHSWLDARVEVRDSPVEGRGLFATASFAAGEIVSRLGGRLIDDETMRDVAATNARFSALQVDEGLHLLMEWDDPCSRGNHSCDPNLWLADAVTVAARRDIRPGEELTIDYALMTADPGWSMQCNCGAASCRGVVRGDDWRLPGLQRRYRGHFAPFIERRIAAHTR